MKFIFAVNKIFWVIIEWNICFLIFCSFFCKKNVDLFNQIEYNINIKIRNLELRAPTGCEFFNARKQVIYNKKDSNKSYCLYCNDGGQGWIRTIEDEVDGFTVRCIWPLCNLPSKKMELVKGIEPSTC